MKFHVSYIFLVVIASTTAIETEKTKNEKKSEKLVDGKKEKRGLLDPEYFDFDLLHDFEANGVGHTSFDHGLGAHRVITVHKEVPLPVPYPVEKKVPYPVAVPVDRPYPVHVPRPYPVPVEKPVPYPVDRPVPYPVKVEVKVPVPHPVPVPYPKPVPYPVHRPVPYPVKVPVVIEKQVPIFVKEHEGHHGFDDGYDFGGNKEHNDFRY